MRSVALAGLVLLGACKQQPAEQVVTVDLPSSPAASLSPEPTTAAKPNGSASVPVRTEAAKIPDRFQALGTEPFWSIEVNGDKLRYSSPENLEGTPFVVAKVKDAGSARYSGRLDGKPVLLTIAPGTCSDGMSDTVYAYKAEFKWGDQTQQGCARLK